MNQTQLHTCLAFYDASHMRACRSSKTQPAGAMVLKSEALLWVSKPMYNVGVELLGGSHLAASEEAFAVAFESALASALAAEQEGADKEVRASPWAITLTLCALLRADRNMFPGPAAPKWMQCIGAFLRARTIAMPLSSHSL